MVENCGDGRTGARGRERGSFELCGALEGGGGPGCLVRPPNLLEFGVVARAGGRRDTMRGGGESCKRVWEGVPLTSTALGRINETLFKTPEHQLAVISLRKICGLAEMLLFAATGPYGVRPLTDTAGPPPVSLNLPASVEIETEWFFSFNNEIN